MRHEPRLDSLRAFCVLAVFAFHTELMAFGWIGVQAFFVLSGYLITGILLSSKTAAPSSREFFKIFYIRRSLRIFPLYYGFIFLLMALSAIPFLANELGKDYFASLPYLLFYVENFRAFALDYDNNGYFAHLWSLCVEEQFYLFWPLIIWLVPQRRLPVLCCLIVVSGLLFRSWVLGYGDPHFRSVAAPRMLFTHLDAFAIGALARMLVLKGISVSAISLAPSALAVIAGGAIIYLATKGTLAQTSWKTLGWSPSLAGAGAFAWGYTLLNLFFAHLVVVLVSHRDREPLFLRVFDWRPFIEIGKISYGFYIIHGPVLTFAKAVLPWSGVTMWAAIALSLVATIGVSSASYRYFELPFLRLKDKWEISARKSLSNA